MLLAQTPDDLINAFWGHCAPAGDMKSRNGRSPALEQCRIGRRKFNRGIGGREPRDFTKQLPIATMGDPSGFTAQ